MYIINQIVCHVYHKSKGKIEHAYVNFTSILIRNVMSNFKKNCDYIFYVKFNEDMKPS